MQRGCSADQRFRVMKRHAGRGWTAISLSRDVRCVAAQHVVARHDFGVFSVQIGQGHQMDVLGAAMRAAKIRLVEREGRIRHQDGGKPQIACGACSGLDRIVSADADNHQVHDAARVQPALESGVDKGIGDVLFDHVFMGQWMEAGLEFHAGLSRCEDGVR